MSIRIAPIVLRVCQGNGEYTPQEVVDYILNEGDDSFIGNGILSLREEAHKTLGEIIEKYNISVDQKLQRDSSEAGKSISDLLSNYSSRKIGLILKKAREDGILI